MAIRRFRIDNDKQIARAILKSGSESRREMIARANLVGVQYRALGNRIISQKGYKSPSSPFEDKDHLSVLDKTAFKVRVIDDHIEISVEAPAAQFVETGNEPGPSDENMAIRIKSSKVKRSKGKRGKTRYTLSNGTKIRKFQGKYYLFTQKAKPFRGYRLLEKSVRTAFRRR